VHHGPSWFGLAAQKAWAEFIGMFLFVFMGCSSAINGGVVLQIALTFGFAIFVLAHTIGHHSGGQMNCAVTFALVITGDIAILQGIINFIAQMLGSITASFVMWAVFPTDKDSTTALGCNIISTGYSRGGALIGEIIGTFLLVFVVMECAVNPTSHQGNATLAIGIAVFLAHAVLIAVDGCSINPTRSFGPAVVASIRYEVESESQHHMKSPHDIWEDHWVFWLGPLLGAGLAALLARFWWHPGNWQHPVAQPVVPNTQIDVESEHKQGGSSEPDAEQM